MKRISALAVWQVVLALGGAGGLSGESGVEPEPKRAEMETKKRPANRLSREKSPYLLQHQYNPVDWHPWGEEAFEKARRENKPVLLSIGYSTCHWCHVMERESFESDEVAAVLNEQYVAIKLDREERPDIDHIYMTAMQALGLGGGWPLNVFLTPDRKPFFGGTYFPKERFVAALRHVDKLWRENREELTADADKLTQALQEHMAGQKAPEGSEPLAKEIPVQAARAFTSIYDAEHGGWGRAPKFPQPQVPGLLLLAGRLGGEPVMVQQVLETCRKMAAGGMFDQVGGGFARYSVDAQWLVPHFEKMLYDNAQLMELYLDAGLVSGEEEFHGVVRRVAGYVRRDMTHAEGGWYSAEDADSEGHEGKFHCWSEEEFRRVVGAEDADWAVGVFGVTAKGNFVDHSHPEPLAGQNVLSWKPVKAARGEEATRLARVQAALQAARVKRVRPHLDDKVLTSWNGLMLAAMARAGVVLGDADLLKAAQANFAFVRGQLWDAGSATLYHRWRDGGRDEAQLLSAYAFYLHGLVELYQATLGEEVLGFAVSLAESMIRKFGDAREGGFFTSAGGKDLLFRAKDDHDGAEPSGNAMAVYGLLRLAAITERADFRKAADDALRFFRPRLVDSPQSMPLMLKAAAFAAREPFRVVVAGEVGGGDGRRLLAAAHRVYQPFRVVLGTAGPVEPFAKTLPARDGKATAYVCSGKACRPPTGEPGDVTESLTALVP